MKDYRTEIYRAILTAIQQSIDVTDVVQVNNILDLTNPVDVKRGLNLDSAPQPDKYPRIDISNGRFTHSAFEQGMVLASESSDYLAEGGDWPLTRTAEYVITIVTDDMLANTMNNIEEAIQLAILKLGPGLQLPYVSSFSMQGLQRSDASGDNRDRTRLTSQIRVNVTITMNGSELVNQ